MGDDDTAIEKLLFIFRCPTLVDRCACQINDYVITRFGVVLSPDGGAMQQMLRPLQATKLPADVWDGLSDRL